MGDIKDKAKSFLKKFSNPFGSSRKFKGQGHRLGAAEAIDPAPSSRPPAAEFKGQGHRLGAAETIDPASSSRPPTAEVSALKISATKDDKQQWIERENEQKKQHENWRKLQQEKWAKEKGIPPARIPPKATTVAPDPERSKSAATDRTLFDSSQRAALYSSNGKQAAESSSSPIPSSKVPSGQESSDIDLLLTAVEAKEELAIALSTFLSAEPETAAIDVLLRLLRNIVREPTTEKFRKIRMGNPKIKEAIGSDTELLEGLGFHFVEEGGEIWAIMDEPAEENITVLRGVIALVESQVKEPSEPVTVPSHSGESATVNSVTPSVDRQLRVFFASPDNSAAAIQLPESFYELSVAEIKSEAARRRKKLEESEMLIPKSYREKQAAAGRRKYKFALIRVQFPDGMIIQGVFLPREPTTALYEFVESALASGGLDFELCHPSANRNGTIASLALPNINSKTLEEVDLVPTALLKFRPLTTNYDGLRPEYLAKSEPLTAIPF